MRATFLKRWLRRVVPPGDEARSAERKARRAIELCHTLLSERGEVSGAALAVEALPENALKPYVDLHAADFAPAPNAILSAADAYRAELSAHNLIALQHAAGMMINYVYRLADVGRNHEAFVRGHEIAASYEMKKLARECVLHERAESARP